MKVGTLEMNECMLNDRWGTAIVYFAYQMKKYRLYVVEKRAHGGGLHRLGR